MSSGFQLSDPQSSKLPSCNGAHISEFESPLTHSKLAQAAARTTETHNSSPLLRFNSLTLDELSEELDRRTKETQRLQDEVEDATKLTLEGFGCVLDMHSSPGQSCCNQRFNVSDVLPAESAVLSNLQQAVTEPLVSTLDIQRDVSFNEEELFKNDCLQQLSDLQLSKTHNQHKQKAFSLDKAIMNLQTELHKVQTETDLLSNLRLKDSREHVDQMEEMLCMLKELQNRIRHQKGHETEEEALALNRRAEKLEQHLKKMLSSLLSKEKQCGNNAITTPNVTASSRRLSIVAELTEELKDETDRLQERLFLSVEHPRSEECRGLNKQKERMEDLIASLGQEMALLTEKLNSSSNNSVSISDKLELLKKLAERQTSLHQSQVCCLEQKLIQVQSQFMDAQREKEQSLQQAEELQSQLDQLKRCGVKQHCELQEELRALRGQLETVREQLCIEGEEKISLQALLEQGAREGRKSQELLQEKNKTVHLMMQEAQQHCARFEEAQRQYQTLYADRETLRLKLADQEKMIDILRVQMESSMQMTVQDRHTIDNLYQENSLLSNQLNHHKLEIQRLKTELDQHKSDMTAVEQERRRLQASLAEQSQRVQEESLEKQQLKTQLELQHVELFTLKKEHRQLQQLHSCQEEEHKGVVLKLQSQLRNVHNELDQVRSTLRTLEGADGHGLQTALDMQEKITAKREQIDSLQGKIQHLEGTVEKLHQEKRYQSLEYQHQLQELNFIREEKRQLGNELEALRSKDKQLRDRISQLEAILHKMSESFAEYQDFIQLQEQEFFRLKLQHALDLKQELKGHNLHTTLNVPPPCLGPPLALTVSPSSQLTSNAQIPDSPTCKLSSLVKELQEVISENHRPHTDNNTDGSSFQRRRSAPEKVHSTTFSADKAEELKAGSKCRRKTCGSETHFLKTAELNGKKINKPFHKSPFRSPPATATRDTSSPQLLSLGRRSPVYCLLTSDSNSQQ